MKKLILIILSASLLQACSMSRSQTGAFLGSATSTSVCIEMGITTDPYATATCAVVGAFAGAEMLYNSDKDVHNAVFVDHLNTAPSGASYTNWYNPKTGNSGIIHTTRSYVQGPLKCTDYDHTVDITNSWPLVGVGGVNRKVEFGTACQLPDGQWIEKPRLN